MKCASCNGFGWVRPAYTACPRCRGRGKLFPQLLGEDETPLSALGEMAVMLIGFAIVVAAFFLACFL